MEQDNSKKGVLIGLVVLIAAIVGIVALTQADPEPFQDADSTSAVEGVEAPTDLVDGTYAVQTTDSSVEWEAAKTLIVDWSHRGTVDLESGTLEVTDGMLSGGEFVVDMTSINVTGDGAAARQDREGLVGHLSSDDFFSVENYPTAAFTITDVAIEDGVYMVTGDMTIKDTTQSLTFPVEVINNGDSLTALASMMINRADFDVRFGSSRFFDDLGDNVINDEFSLDVLLVADLQDETQE